MADTNRSKPVFTALNAHTANCGEPPEVTTDRGRYCGYFENAYGEQWVLVIDRATRRGQLRGGDCGWEKVFDITISNEGEATGIPILGRAEQEWLKACLRAAIA